MFLNSEKWPTYFGRARIEILNVFNVNRQKPKDIKLSIICGKENHLVLTFEKLDQTFGLFAGKITI